METNNFKEQMELIDLYKKLTTDLESEVVYYNGCIAQSVSYQFANYLQCVKKKNKNRENLSLILNTSGGQSEAVVTILKALYDNYSMVNVYVYDVCASSGTVIALGCNEINMTNYSRVGAIDSYELIRNSIIPLTLKVIMYDELNFKIKEGSASPHEINMFNSKFNPVEIEDIRLKDEYVQEIAVSFMVKNSGINKEEATDIYNNLSNIRKWKSHQRPIFYDDLIKECPKLKVNNYSKNEELFDLLSDYTHKLSKWYRNHDVFCYVPHLIYAENELYREVDYKTV